MCCIDTNDVVFVERVDEVICGVNTRLISITFCVELGCGFWKTTADICCDRDILLLFIAYISMINFPYLAMFFGFYNRNITEPLSLVFCTKKRGDLFNLNLKEKFLKY